MGIRNRLGEGGPGSGFFGHAGRPGQQGGSSSGGGGGVTFGKTVSKPQSKKYLKLTKAYNPKSNPDEVSGKRTSAEYGKGDEYIKLRKAYNTVWSKRFRRGR